MDPLIVRMTEFARRQQHYKISCNLPLNKFIFFIFYFLVKQNQVWWCPVKVDDQKGYTQHKFQAFCVAILYESGFSDRNKRIKEEKKRNKNLKGN